MFTMTKTKFIHPIKFTVSALIYIRLIRLSLENIFQIILTPNSLFIIWFWVALGFKLRTWSLKCATTWGVSLSLFALIFHIVSYSLSGAILRPGSSHLCLLCIWDHRHAPPQLGYLLRCGISIFLPGMDLYLHSPDLFLLSKITGVNSHLVPLTPFFNF
jgi:hypothetical protein